MQQPQSVKGIMVQRIQGGVCLDPAPSSPRYYPTTAACLLLCKIYIWSWEDHVSTLVVDSPTVGNILVDRGRK